MDLYQCTLPAIGDNCTSSLLDESKIAQDIRIGMLALLLVCFMFHVYVQISHITLVWKKSKASSRVKDNWDRVRYLMTFKNLFLSLMTISIASGFLYVFFGMFLSAESKVLSVFFLLLTAACQGSGMVSMYFGITKITDGTFGKEALSKRWVYFSIIYPFMACGSAFMAFLFAFGSRDSVGLLKTAGLTMPLTSVFLLVLRWKTGEQAVQTLKKHRIRSLDLKEQGEKADDILCHIERQIRKSLNRSSWVNVFWTLLALALFVPEINSSPITFLFFTASFLVQLPLFPLVFISLEKKYRPRSSTQRWTLTFKGGKGTGMQTAIEETSSNRRTQFLGITSNQKESILESAVTNEVPKSSL